MNVKMALLALLIVVAATAMFATALAAFNEAPSTENIEASSNITTVTGDIQPMGDEKPGGWPSNG